VSRIFGAVFGKAYVFSADVKGIAQRTQVDEGCGGDSGDGDVVIAAVTTDFEIEALLMRLTTGSAGNDLLRLNGSGGEARRGSVARRLAVGGLGSNCILNFRPGRLDIPRGRGAEGGCLAAEGWMMEVLAR